MLVGLRYPTSPSLRLSALANFPARRLFGVQIKSIVGQPAFGRPWGISGIFNSDWDHLGLDSHLDWDSQLGFLFGILI